MSNPPTANPLHTHAHAQAQAHAQQVHAAQVGVTQQTPNPIGVPTMTAVPIRVQVGAPQAVAAIAGTTAMAPTTVPVPVPVPVSSSVVPAPGPKEEYEEIREQDRYLPIANIARIMKNTLPENAKIAKDSKETVQECVSEFISFITSEASDKCMQEKRKTINGDDLLWAMSTLGFDKYVEPLKIYLSKYREAIRGDKPDTKGGSGGSHLGRPPATAASVGGIGLPSGSATSAAGYQVGASVGVPPS